MQLQALRRLEDGIPVILATGTSAPSRTSRRFIGLSPMCCENGGVLWHPDWDEPLLEHLVMKQRKRKAIRILKSMQEAFKPTLERKRMVSIQR